MNTVYYKDPKPAPPEKKVYTLAEAARILGIGYTTARTAVQNGTFPVTVIKIQSIYRVSKAELDAFVDGRASA